MVQPIIIPSSPTFSIARAMRLPMWASPLAEMVGNLGYFGGGGDSFGLSRQELNDVVDSCLRALAEIHGVAISSYIFYTFRIDNTSEDSGCCHTIPSYFVCFFVCFLSDILNETGCEEKFRRGRWRERNGTYWAPRFSNLSFSIINLATVTPW